jgi:hypothetical protein
LEYKNMWHLLNNYVIYAVANAREAVLLQEPDKRVIGVYHNVIKP